MESNLFPCPFCNKTPSINRIDSGERDVFEVICMNPECSLQVSTLHYPREDQAIETWNNRERNIIIKEIDIKQIPNSDLLKELGERLK